MSIGAYGSMARTVLGRSNASIAVTLQDGSASNDILSALHKNDRTSRNLDWVFQVTLKSGERTFFTAPFAYIENYPVKSYSTEASTVTWNIVCNDLQQHIGGAGFIDTDTESTLADLGYTVDPYYVQ